MNTNNTVDTIMLISVVLCLSLKLDWLAGGGAEFWLWSNADDCPVSSGGAFPSQHDQLVSLPLAAHPHTHTPERSRPCKVTFAAAALFRGFSLCFYPFFLSFFLSPKPLPPPISFASLYLYTTEILDSLCPCVFQSFKSKIKLLSSSICSHINPVMIPEPYVNHLFLF